MMNKKKITISMLLMVASMFLLSACISGGTEDALVGNNGNGDGLVCPGDPVCPPGLTCPGDPGCLTIPTAGGALRLGIFPGGKNTQIEHEGGDANAIPRPDDLFGFAVAVLGDLGDNGTIEVAVGAPGDEPSTAGQGLIQGNGAIFIYSLNADGSVSGMPKKTDREGGELSKCNGPSAFGAAIASIDDHDGDGVGDIAVGAPGLEIMPSCIPGATFLGIDSGGVYILYMNIDGTVKSSPAPVLLTGGESPEFNANENRRLGEGNFFGNAVVDIGDMDGNMVRDLAVGAPGRTGCSGVGSPSNNGFVDDAGNVFILFMEKGIDGVERVKERVILGSKFHRDPRPGLISRMLLCVEATPNLGTLHGGGNLGSALVNLGDLDGDGGSKVVLVAGEPGRNRIRILFLNAEGTIEQTQLVSATDLGLPNDARFGASLAVLGDIIGDGIPDIAVGAPEVMISTSNTDLADNQKDGNVYLLDLDMSGGTVTARVIRTIPAGRTGGAGWRRCRAAGYRTEWSQELYV